ncbi:acyltransferase [Chlorogloea sp. CCALA 695]|uniref:acyltransferase n=1 Tax=Chlorogloea sp. CCALA 695 TaxID=2107693 RepID=UPI000D06E13F|nr:acyltransferase [Chlorogloea sp. CCALA 695]PSB28642.1 transferase [Chlorogloea sp. CCALA 695]
MIFNNSAKLTRAKELLVTTGVGWIPQIAGGNFLRRLAYRLIFKKIGASVYIQNGTELIGADRIEVGSNAFMAQGVSIVISKLNSKVLLGESVSLSKGVIINPAGSNCCIEIDRHTFIGPYTCIGGPGNVKIGKYCLIAAHSGIVANNHIFSDPTEMIHLQGVTRQGVVIEDNCWLGYGVKVLDGVTIGEGSVIGAGAVVTKNIPPYSVAVGVPAKVVRSRQLVEKQFTNWREAS